MDKKIRVSLILNIVIAACVTIATVMTFCNIRISFDGLGEAKGIEPLKYFTIQSNLLTGLTAIALAVIEILFLKGKISRIPNVIYTLKFAFNVSVTLTMTTVVVYLAPTSENGYFSLFMNANFFYHFFVPLLSIVSFTFFEPTDTIPFKHTFFGVAHFLVYGAVYMAVAYSHMGDAISKEQFIVSYNWYGLANENVLFTVFSSVVMTAFTYFTALATWFLNRKIFKKSADRSING